MRPGNRGDDRGFILVAMLISIAVALTTQCSYCIDAHAKNAARAGATREEIAEAVFIASALRAGAAVGHGLLALRLYDEAVSL